MGVRGTTLSLGGTAGVFINNATPAPGKILSGVASGTEVFRVDGNGDVVSAGGDFRALAPGKGIILVSPDGSACARISLSDEGALVTEATSCPL